MKYIFLLILMISLFNQSCSAMSKESKLANSFLDAFAKEQRMSRGLVLSGTGRSVRDKIQVLEIFFLSWGCYNVDQARNIFMQSLEDFSNKINCNMTMRPHLANYPFNEFNLGLDISFYESPGKRPQKPYVALVSLIKGKIFYFFYDNEKQKFVDDYSETYQEALQKVKS